MSRYLERLVNRAGLTDATPVSAAPRAVHRADSSATDIADPFETVVSHVVHPAAPAEPAAPATLSAHTVPPFAQDEPRARRDPTPPAPSDGRHADAPSHSADATRTQTKKARESAVPLVAALHPHEASMRDVQIAGPAPSSVPGAPASSPGEGITRGPALVAVTSSLATATPALPLPHDDELAARVLAQVMPALDAWFNSDAATAPHAPEAVADAGSLLPRVAPATATIEPAASRDTPGPAVVIDSLLVEVAPATGHAAAPPAPVRASVRARPAQSSPALSRPNTLRFGLGQI